MSDAFPPLLVDAALRGMAVALLTLLVVRLSRDHPALAVARIGAIFSAGLVVQVIGSAPTFEGHASFAWQAPFVGIAVGNAALFWIFVEALFDDDFVLRPWHIAAWVLAAGLAAFNCAGGWVRTTTFGRLAIDVQHALPLLFAALAAFAVGSTWRADLVERRRHLRMFIAISGVAYSFVMLGVRLTSAKGRLSESGALLDTTVLLAMIAVAAIGLLRVVGSGLLPPDPRPDDAVADDDAPPSMEVASQAIDPDDERLAATLERTIRDERIHRIEGLTVAGLAARLSVPEYRLRRVVNGRLGHRNFNSFINAFRLDDARAALADPARRKLPVLTIALDAGFQSIGPFNRAFKAATGVTPTEFRRRHVADP